MANDIMLDHIGIFRELDKNERIEFESRTIMPTVFMKEAEIKKVLGKERKEFPISFTATNIYVTNKKLYFLILYQMGAKELTGEEKKSALSGIAGTWFEIPITAINSVDNRMIKLNNLNTETDMKMLVTWGLLKEEELNNASCVEIVYNEEDAMGRAKDYMEANLGVNNFMGRIFNKVEKVSDKLFIIGKEATPIIPSLKRQLK